MSQDLTTLPTKHHITIKVLLLPTVLLCLNSLSDIHSSKARPPPSHRVKVLARPISPWKSQTLVTCTWCSPSRLKKRRNQDVGSNL